MSRYRGLFLLFVLAFGLPKMLGAEESLSLPALLLKARDNNPEVIAARCAWKVK